MTLREEVEKAMREAMDKCRCDRYLDDVDPCAVSVAVEMVERQAEAGDRAIRIEMDRNGPRWRRAREHYRLAVERAEAAEKERDDAMRLWRNRTEEDRERIKGLENALAERGHVARCGCYSEGPLVNQAGEEYGYQRGEVDPRCAPEKP